MWNIDPKISGGVGVVVAALGVFAYMYGNDEVKATLFIVAAIIFIVTVVLLIAWGAQTLFDRFEWPTPIDWLRDRLGW